LRRGRRVLARDHGEDEEQGDELRAIEFPRIQGHKKFDVSVGWFQELLGSLGQA